MRRASSAVLLTLLVTTLAAACGEKKTDPTAPPAPPSASASAAPEAPEGPLAVVLESKSPIVLSALAGGLVVADQARAHLARTNGAGELAVEPMPPGLPEGPGQILRAAGKTPGHVWIVYETLREDGKIDKNPLFRLEKAGFKKYADDWKPLVAAWTKNRILAASTSSGKLKIKLIEPSLKDADLPPDLPSARLSDAACEKSVRLEAIGATAAGDVFAAGNCKPDVAAGAGASATRYVVIRWPVATAASDAGADPAGDAGASDAGAPEKPGLVDVIPGVSVNLAHEALHVRSESDVWVAARDTAAKPAGASRLFHFDGATWGAVALPPAAAVVRALAGAADGTLWLASERAIFRRATSGAWEEIPLPRRALGGEGAWEIASLVSDDRGDVWIAARKSGARDVLLRTRPAPAVTRWE
jgi:hypothetical protein